MSKRPNSEWLADLKTADTMVLHQMDRDSLTITDPSTIRRFQKIYEDSKWSKYWGTVPATLDVQTITLQLGDAELRLFQFTGFELWESTSYTENRTTSLNDADREWLDSLFNEPL